MSEFRKKRMIPRHVDGRIKIGTIPIRQIPKVLIVSILLIIAVMKNFSPISLFLGILGLAIIVFIFSEFNGETGVDFIKAIIKYEREGDIHFERSCLLEDENKRFTIKNIKKRQ